MSIEAAPSGPQEFLLGRIDYERTPLPDRASALRLDRMRDLLARLGDPHLGLNVVHIAGTKGKGSTAAMTASVLTAAGYRVGLYSSPHLERIEERLRIDGVPCTTERFHALVQQVRPSVEALDEECSARGEHGPTFFEITTAMAFLHFAEAKVDAVALEVGLGGRLDSTNVCQPRVSVITSISFDHMKQLGNTLSSIAREKAGIIKPGIPVVSGVLADEPREVIEEICRERDAPLIQLGRDFSFDYRPPRELDDHTSHGTLDFLSAEGSCWNNVEIGLLGYHQAANATLALATLRELTQQGWQVSEAAMRKGLANLNWPARIEVVARHPTVIVDSAHNAASIASLVRTLEESFRAGRRILIFATTRDKEVRPMLELLLPQFDEVIFTRYAINPRAVPTEDLLSVAEEIRPGARHAQPDVEQAWAMAQSLARPRDLVCITGSFFLAAEMRAVLAKQGT